MNFLASLQSIKLIAEFIKFCKTNIENIGLKWIVIIAALFAGLLSYASKSLQDYQKNQSARHYNDVLRDSYAYRQIVETLKTCGDKTSVMIGAVSTIEKVGIIKDFYSCVANDSKSCITNTKEIRQEYQESYIVDDATYSFLHEISNHNIIIDLQTGFFTSPITHNKFHISQLLTLNKLLDVSGWYHAGYLKTLRIGVIVDNQESVIFTISITSANECVAGNELITNLKEIYNQNQQKYVAF